MRSDRFGNFRNLTGNYVLVGRYQLESLSTNVIDDRLLCIEHG